MLDEAEQAMTWMAVRGVVIILFKLFLLSTTHGIMSSTKQSAIPQDMSGTSTLSFLDCPYVISSGNGLASGTFNTKSDLFHLDSNLHSLLNHLLCL